MDRNLLVTGAAGFVGRRFVSYLHNRGPWRKIQLLDRISPVSNLEELHSFMDSRMTFFHRDLTVDPLTDLSMPQLDILHLAAESHVDRSFHHSESFFTHNVMGTLRLLRFFEETKATYFLHLSTDEVYGPSRKKRRESDPFFPTSPYAISKATADQLLQYYQKTLPGRLSLLRSCNLYGPGQHQEKLIPTILHCIGENRPIPLYGDGLASRHWLFSEDLMPLLHRLLEERVGDKCYNVSSPETLSNRHLAEKIIALCGKGEIRHVADRPLHDIAYEIDDTLIQRELGWNPPTDLEQGLRETIRAFQRKIIPDGKSPAKSVSPL